MASDSLWRGWRDVMLDKKRRGRPITSRDAKVIPEFREDPDIEKLGRALIAVAMRIAEQKQAEENAKKLQRDEGDNMT